MVALLRRVTVTAIVAQGGSKELCESNWNVRSCCNNRTASSQPLSLC